MSHLRVDVVTLFPGMFEGPFSNSLLKKAQEKQIFELVVHDLRTYSADPKHHKVDDRPYGGGAGMVIQAEPLYLALQAIKKIGKKAGAKKPQVIFLSPQGPVLSQTIAKELSEQSWLILICGHYEGLDERFMEYVDAEVSVGDYVLTGGELPAMVLIDCVVRLVPGVVKESSSIEKDSFQNGLLDYPHYTRPATWRGQDVPEVLLSGDHLKIEAWRLSQAQNTTRRKRPDLLK